jgi:hypothetical protein
VEDAWRTQVAPALADIREALAEHGLLSEAASIALGDPRRLLVEAGGVLAVAHGEVLSLSALLTTGLAPGLPLADIAGPGTETGSRGKARRAQECVLLSAPARRGGGPTSLSNRRAASPTAAEPYRSPRQ